MTSTVITSINADEWTELANGSANVLVQITSHGFAEIFVGTAAPEGAAGVGHPVNQFMPFTFSDLETTDKVYGRSRNGSLSVAVTKSAEAA